ncbi:hypothetical protein A3D78_02040 [Candidatus Gottesmanbacteria bacterium RIFCSPHIGHO2_02_FULL_39_14]|uniref:Uncharacterized protein n=3 Tax=Candidatus Gottesmaniibacteriota TaxID=1752720 RepID=A0A1F6A2E9_9BACT|nr:MAG: hypothetical protein A2153_04830 [Candidatus Gottesmanbacteria bacterium RBG_16_38_7b]OGG18774.1 MAG: hypothetical protein A3D78_02040 [Candidatus Gottesmanbacteria bacterium RIFCSPHIGHO2_02_FULL_39_14]OGG30942.1 MAG: hypothetical protein A3I51_02635 [Candidatus Gottesmanbacteria bacterium RIFCSPLOWO2_02_FULL_38_8]
MSNKERKSRTEKFAEFLKKVDKIGILAGLSMIVFGAIFLSQAAVTGGVILAGSSGATYLVEEKVRRSAERKRKAKTIYRY